MLGNDNFENDLDIAIANTEIKADQLHSGRVYSDINDERQNLTLKLLSTIDNIKSKIMVASNTAVSTIIYYSKSRLILLNNCKNLFYFPVAFLTLFFFGDSGHFRKKQQLVSIEVWVN